MGRSEHRRAQRAEQIWRSGATAVGTVAEVVPTKEKIDGVPRVRITLQIAAPGRDPWTATVLALVPPEDAPKIAIGRDLPVRFDPDDPQQIAIVVG